MATEPQRPPAPGLLPADRGERALAALLVGVVLAIFVPHLGNGFVWDDHGFLEQNPAVTGEDPWTAAFTRDAWYAHAEAMPGRVLYYRPLLVLAARGLWALGGGAPAPFHAAAVLFHLAAVALLFALLVDLGSSRRFAGGAAALFAVHPLVGEVTYWASALGEPLSLALLLAALLAVRRGRAAAGGRRPLLLGIAALAAFGALLAKETGLVVPVLVTAEALRAPREAWRRRLAGTWVAWAPVLPYLGLRAAFVGGVGTGLAADLGPRVERALSILAWDLGRLAWPFPLSPHHVEGGAGWPSPWVGALALGALLGLAARLARRRAGELFWLAWLGAGLAPPIAQVLLERETGLAVAERYLYLPLPAAVVALVGLLGWVSSALGETATRLRLPAAAAVLVALSAQTSQYGRSFDGDAAWAARTLEVHPGAPAALRVVAADAVRRGDPAAALPLLREAVAREPGRAASHFNLGLGLWRLGRLEEALGAIEAGLRLEPRNGTGRLLAADALRDLGRLPEAGAQYAEAVRWAPANVDARQGYGAWLFLQGRVAEATGQWREGLRLRPGSCELRFNLGMALVQQGRRGEAEAVLAPFVAGCGRELPAQAAQAAAWLGRR
jgi:tetratricopeptide (TPR) repeat protein